MEETRSEIQTFDQVVEQILAECRVAFGRVDPETIERFMDAVLAADKVFFVGVGRVMLSLMAMAKRMAHLGVHACIVGETTEPAITDRDLLVVGSGSGESLIPVIIARKAKSFGAKIAHLGSNPDSSLKAITDIFIRIPVRTKLALPDEIDSLQPMTSLFEQTLLLLGDAIAQMIIHRRRVEIGSLWQFHANLE